MKGTGSLICWPFSVCIVGWIDRDWCFVASAIEEAGGGRRGLVN